MNGLEEEKNLDEIEDEEARLGIFSRQDYRLIRFLLEETGIPEEWVHRFWICFSRSIVLTNLTDRDVRILIMQWDDLTRLFRMSMPHYKYTYDIEIALSQLRQLYISNLKRSTGGAQRERVIIGSQITPVSYTHLTLPTKA